MYLIKLLERIDSTLGLPALLVSLVTLLLVNRLKEEFTHISNEYRVMFGTLHSRRTEIISVLYVKILDVNESVRAYTLSRSRQESGIPMIDVQSEVMSVESFLLKIGSIFPRSRTVL